MLKMELLYPPNGKEIAITGIFKFSVLHKKLLTEASGVLNSYEGVLVKESIVGQHH